MLGVSVDLMVTKTGKPKFPNALNYRRLRYQETVDKDMTQEKLAELSGFSQGKISKLESGAADLSFADAKKLATCLKISDVRELFEKNYRAADDKENWVILTYRVAPQSIKDIIDKALEMVTVKK